jgi:Tol biopolymer transport system component
VAAAFLLLSVGGIGVWRTGESNAAPVPKVTDEGLLWVYDPTGELIAFTPDGTKAKTVRLHDESAANVALYGISEDGQFALFGGVDGKLPEKGWDYDTIRRGKLTLHRKPLHGDGPVMDTGIAVGLGNRFVAAPDGGLLHSHNLAPMRDPPPVGVVSEYVTTRYDATGKNPEKLDLPESMHLQAVLPNGDLLVTSDHIDEYKEFYQRLHRCRPGEEPVSVSDEVNPNHLAVSPDGKSLLVTHYRQVILNRDPDREFYKLGLLDVASGKFRQIGGYENTGYVRGFWAPDGRRIAVQWNRYVGDPRDRWRAGAGEIAVFDADGTNRRVVLKLDDPGTEKPPRRLLGWYPAKRNAPVPKAGDDPGLIWTHHCKADKLVAYTPDGKVARELDLPDGPAFLGLSRDGTRIHFAGRNGKPGNPREDTDLTLHVRELGADSGTDLGVGYQQNDQFVFSPDGKQVVRTRIEALRQNASHIHSNVQFDLATKKETDLKLPADHQVCRWADDGKEWWVLQYNIDADPKLPVYRWHRHPVGGGKPAPLCDGVSLMWLEPVPGKQTLLGVGHLFPTDKAGLNAVLHIDPAAGKAREVVRFDGVSFAQLRQSPSGHRLAVMKFDWDPADKTVNDSHLVLLDPDGKNEVKLHTYKDDEQQTLLLGWYPTPAKPADPRRKNAPVPKAAPPEGVIVVASSGPEKPLEVVKPDGTAVRVVNPDVWDRTHLVRQSPDGKRVVWTDRGPDDPTAKSGIPWWVRWLDLGADPPKAKVIVEDAFNRSVAWSADGMSVYYSRIDPTKFAAPPQRGDPLRFETWVHDLATDTRKRVDLPAEHAVLEVSPDGKTLLTRTIKFEQDEQVMHLVPTDTRKPERLGEAVAVVYSPRFSPDGKHILYSRITDTPAERMKPAVCVIDVATKKETPVPLPKGAEAGGVYHLCWSPDGRRIALHWHEAVPPKPGVRGVKGSDSASRVTVMDADGGNATVVVKRDPSDDVTGLDWR